MNNNELMTDIMSKMMQLTDVESLDKIQNSAFNRKRELRQKGAAISTASWKINDEVQMLPEHRSRKPYGAKGKIAKINKVRMRIDFGNGYVFNVPKSMLMIAV